jgi:hypothetical protein
MTKLKTFFLNVLKFHCIELFILLQSTCCLLCLIVYPSFESFITIVTWFDFLLVFYWLALLKIPVLLLTVGTFCTLKCFIVVQYMPLSSACIIFLILLSSVTFFFVYKDTILSFEFLNRFRRLEEEVESKFKKDYMLFGVSNSLILFTFLLCNYIRFADSSFFLTLFELYSSFFWPASFLFSLFLILSGLTEIVLCLTISANFFTCTQFVLVRIAKFFFGLLLQLFCFHDHCIGGEYDPLSCFEVVKSYQRDYFGAVATTRHEVNSLKLYRTLDQVTPPPFIEGTYFVDVKRLDVINNLLLEKKKADSTAIANAIKEAAIHFIYDHTVSESENEKNFDKLASSYIKKRLATFTFPITNSKNEK